MRIPPSDPFPHPPVRDAAADLKDLLGAIEDAHTQGSIFESGSFPSGRHLLEVTRRLRKVYP